MTSVTIWVNVRIHREGLGRRRRGLQEEVTWHTGRGEVVEEAGKPYSLSEHEGWRVRLLLTLDRL